MESMSTTISRHERRRRETADRLLEAAGHLFGTRGVQATSVADICARADVAHQTFFNHFPTKQDVVREIARRGLDFLLDAIETAHREGRDTTDRLRRLFVSIHAATEGVGPMHQELLAQTLRATAEEWKPTRTREREIDAAFESLLRTGVAEGGVTRRHALPDLVDLVTGAFYTLVFAWSKGEGGIAERGERMARLLGDALAPRPDETTRARARAKPKRPARAKRTPAGRRSS